MYCFIVCFFLTKHYKEFLCFVQFCNKIQNIIFPMPLEKWENNMCLRQGQLLELRATCYILLFKASRKLYYITVFTSTLHALSHTKIKCVRIMLFFTVNLYHSSLSGENQYPKVILLTTINTNMWYSHSME